MKTDRILNDLYEKKESIGNLTEAMQETAVQFAEWREYKHCAFNTETKLWYIFGVDNKGYTTKELFNLFNNEE